MQFSGNFLSSTPHGVPVRRMRRTAVGDEATMLLILDAEAPAAGDNRALQQRLRRSRALNVIATAGGRVRHDSGGRVIVIGLAGATDRDTAARTIAENLPEAWLGPLGSDLARAVADLDPAERLFVEALRVRTSPAYREAKSRRRVGESPEEQALLSGSCVREEY
jgi:hypothetical protein